MVSRLEHQGSSSRSCTCLWELLIWCCCWGITSGGWKFWSDSLEFFFTMSLDKLWNRLSRQVGKFLSLETFKVLLGETLDNLIKLGLLWVEIWSDDLQKHLPAFFLWANIPLFKTCCTLGERDFFCVKIQLLSKNHKTPETKWKHPLNVRGLKCHHYGL